MSIRATSITGVKWTSISTVLITVMQFTKLAVLARYLHATDFGLMALVMVLVGFAQAFMDMGISSAIIHRQQISHIQLSTLYWLGLISGGGVDDSHCSCCAVYG